MGDDTFSLSVLSDWFRGRAEIASFVIFRFPLITAQIKRIRERDNTKARVDAEIMPNTLSLPLFYEAVVCVTCSFHVIL